MQRVISDLQQRFGQKHISSGASCNPDNPDTKLRISDNALRWEDTSLTGQDCLCKSQPVSDARILSRIFTAQHRESLSANAIAQAEHEWEEQRHVALALAQHERTWTRIELQPDSLGLQNGHPRVDKAEKPLAVQFVHPTLLPVEVTASPYHHRMI